MVNRLVNKYNVASHDQRPETEAWHFPKPAPKMVFARECGDAIYPYLSQSTTTPHQPPVVSVPIERPLNVVRWFYLVGGMCHQNCSPTLLLVTSSTVVDRSSEFRFTSQSGHGNSLITSYGPPETPSITTVDDCITALCDVGGFQIPAFFAE